MDKQHCDICDRKDIAWRNTSNQKMICPSCVTASGFHMCGNSSFLIKATIRGKISRAWRKLKTVMWFKKESIVA